MDGYFAAQIHKVQASGLDPSATAAQVAAIQHSQQLYQNPLVNMAYTFKVEPLPVGFIITLISAGILRRKSPRAPSRLIEQRPPSHLYAAGLARHASCVPPSISFHATDHMILRVPHLSRRVPHTPILRVGLGSGAVLLGFSFLLCELRALSALCVNSYSYFPFLPLSTRSCRGGFRPPSWDYSSLQYSPRSSVLH